MLSPLDRREKYEPGLYRIRHPLPGRRPDARAAIMLCEGAEAGAYDLTAEGCPPCFIAPPLPPGGAAVGRWRRIANADFDSLVGRRVRLVRDPAERLEREDAERGPLGVRSSGLSGVVTTVDGACARG